MCDVGVNPARGRRRAHDETERVGTLLAGRGVVTVGRRVRASAAVVAAVAAIVVVAAGRRMGPGGLDVPRRGVRAIAGGSVVRGGVAARGSTVVGVVGGGVGLRVRMGGRVDWEGSLGGEAARHEV